MLHILLFILKIIGIILAVILGIILLVICIVLFVPVCYRAEGESRGTLDDILAHGQISWLFGLVKVVVSVKDKAVDYYIKIAWKKLRDSSETDEEREDVTNEEECDIDPEGWEEIDAVKEAEASESHTKSNPEITEKCQNDPEAAEEAPEEVPKVPERVVETDTKGDLSGKEAAEESPGSSGILEKAGKRIHGIGSGIKKSCEKIKCTFREFCDKIREILKKKDLVAAFITDEIHLRAFGKAKKEVFKLLRRIAPRVLAADIHYGFEDPCLTGQVLAVLGALYPFVGEHAQVTPDFQEKVLEGNIKIRGRIFVVHLAALAVNLLLCREVRRMIKDVREFKL